MAGLKVLASCGQETTIINLRLGPEKYEFIQTHKIGTDNVIKAVGSIIDRSEN